MATNVYQYVSENRPQEVLELINRYGYSIENVESPDDLAECLAQLIANEGEQPLYDLADLHPDSQLIIEACQQRIGQQNITSNNDSCKCGGCKGKSVTGSYIEAAQHANNNHSFLSNQSGLFLIGGLLIITLALIATKN